jgi:hypothetical protein
VAIGGVIVIGILAVVVGLGVFGQPLETMTGDDLAIATVVQGVIAADKIALTPPSRDAAGKVSDAVLATMHARARTLAASLFAEPYRSDWVGRIDAAIDEQGAANPTLGGGIRSTSLWRIRIAGDRATATARAVTYLDTLPIDGQPGIHPVNTADYRFELARIDGAWLVTTWTFEFTPGGGP